MDEAAADEEVPVAVAPPAVAAVEEMAEGAASVVMICVLITGEPSGVTTGVEAVELVIGRVDVARVATGVEEVEVAI